MPGFRFLPENFYASFYVQYDYSLDAGQESELRETNILGS